MVAPARVSRDAGTVPTTESAVGDLRTAKCFQQLDDRRHEPFPLGPGDLLECDSGHSSRHRQKAVTGAANHLDARHRHRRGREPGGEPVLLKVLHVRTEPHDKITPVGAERETRRPGTGTNLDDIAPS